MTLSRRIVFLLLVCGCVAIPSFAQNFYWNTSSPQSIALGGIYVPSSSNVLDALAVDVDVENVWQVRQPLDHDPLTAVALIEERRDHSEAGLLFRGVHALGSGG